MGKRSDFEKRKNDTYDTPTKALIPLLSMLPEKISFAEPCAGKGNITDFLVSKGHECKYQYDLEPRREDIQKLDALEFDKTDYDFIITNPPWSRHILHPMIDHFRKLRPTLLLFDADWAHTKQAKPYLPYCRLIHAIGRVKWIEDSPHVGKDNACWYMFLDRETDTYFMGI